MCNIFQIQIDPLKFITETWKGLSRPIGYLRDPEHRIAQLTKAKKKFEAKRDDRNIAIKNAEHAGEVPTHQVQQWLREVDEFIDQILKIIGDRERGKFCWGINRRAAHILADIKAFQENPELDVITTMLPPKRVQEVPADLPSATMNTYLSKLEAALKDNKSRIIGIWGMGGVGKTTLWSSFNNNLGKSQHNFDYVIWVVVSRDYNLGKLQRDITKRLGLPLCEDRFMQANKIMDFLESKSFLLLLDDLWNPINFAELGIPHPSRSGATKQKVVFTTRREDVCGQMQARHKIIIECLNREEAWQLFQEKVGEETLQANPRIPPLAQQVAEECDGLPLALVLIGSAMSMKKTPSEWQYALTRFKKSRPYEIHGIGDDIFSKLKLSYDYLADEILRQCFLICCLWPEDRPMIKIDLIKFWMGHGLVDELKFDNINEAYDSGYSLIGALQAACLFEQGDDKEREVKMHDLVRDLALWIASDCGKKPNRFIVSSSINIPEDLQREVEGITLLESDSPFLPTKCSELKTLMIQENYYFHSIVPGFFEGTRALTYLDLSRTRISNLPEEICLLGNLRYLDLSFTKISSLPSQLGNLWNLRILLLRNLNIIHIPCGELEKLEMLSLLNMSDTNCDNLKDLFSSLRQLYLKGLGIVLKSIEDLNQLAQLPNVLTWQLVLKNLQGLNQPLQLLSPSQLGSNNIRSSIQKLIINDCESLEVVLMERDGGGGIQKWCLSRLEELELINLIKLQEIVWRGVRPVQMLPSLTVLTIFGCENLSNISWVIGLPSLECLVVHTCTNVQQLIDDDYSEFAHSNDEENGVGTAGPTFRSLRRLKLVKLKSLKVFGGLHTFPSLELLVVIDCPEMKTLPFGEEMAGMKLKMIRGWRSWWEELSMKDNVRATLLPYFQENDFEDLLDVYHFDLRLKEVFSDLKF